MKIGSMMLVVAFLISMALNIWFLWNFFNFSITNDGMQASLFSYEQREVALSCFAKAFIERMDEQELRDWIKNHMAELNVDESPNKIIVNQVGIEFGSKHPVLEQLQYDGKHSN